MTPKNEQVSDFQENISTPNDVPADIPGQPDEPAIVMPQVDPEIIITSQENYDNSLNALLKKYTSGH